MAWTMKRGIEAIPQSEFREVISKFRDILLQRIPKLRSIVLFGSIARGDVRGSTDVDTLVVSDFFRGGASKAADSIIEAFRELKYTEEYQALVSSGKILNVDPIGYASSDLLRTPPLLLDVVEDGIILFDDGSMERVLKGVGQRMRRLGSRRVKTKRGWYWDLKPDYKFGEVIEV